LIFVWEFSIYYYILRFLGEKMDNSEETMTLKEISEAIDIPLRTVYNAVNRLYPNLEKIGPVKRLNMEQATRVKQDLMSKHNFASTGKTCYTPLERAEVIAMAMKLQEDVISELKVQLTEAEEKRDMLIHIGKTYSATEIAKELNFKSAIEFNKLLEKMGIQFKVNGTWVLTAPYSDKGYSQTKQTELENGNVVYNMRWTGLGRDFLLSLDLSNDQPLIENE
jgi:predicted DNA-binding protein YlxM (UPF0122 family)